MGYIVPTATVYFSYFRMLESNSASYRIQDAPAFDVIPNHRQGIFNGPRRRDSMKKNGGETAKSREDLI